MENLIARVATAAHTTPEIARQALALVLDFLVREAPEEAMETLLNSSPTMKAIVASSTHIGGEGMVPFVKGLMGAGPGAMGGGGLTELREKLMELGLSMDQIHAMSKLMFERMRAVAGDDIVSEILEALPGLTQVI